MLNIYIYHFLPAFAKQCESDNYLLWLTDEGGGGGGGGEGGGVVSRLLRGGKISLDLRTDTSGCSRSRSCKRVSVAHRLRAKEVEVCTSPKRTKHGEYPASSSLPLANPKCMKISVRQTLAALQNIGCSTLFVFKLLQLSMQLRKCISCVLESSGNFSLAQSNIYLCSCVFTLNMIRTYW